MKISAFSDFEATHAKQGIGIGSFPIRNKGFAHPSARRITIILSVALMYLGSPSNHIYYDYQLWVRFVPVAAQWFLIVFCP